MGQQLQEMVDACWFLDQVIKNVQCIGIKNTLPLGGLKLQNTERMSSEE